ncbi:dynamin family protein [Aerosakkonema funiforme]|uniref:Dynamin family protein n=1 Tax=Aerosakkonema funiforme FACHB-1375 TaxID=2949571 RepID=A0A926ZGM3_9CYAN|nr:dynamin family protein [Aerosakkonema funiforme]MBD2182150.1 dynamin family protein [Aerosakkonema funiforme FACHB-1375]
MQQQEFHHNLVNILQSALGLLELDRNSQLYRDVTSVCNHLANPGFRIAVFGPFNYGKSTLINAILGNRALPIDIIPTTGAAIYVKYGNELRTRITMTNGREINESGTEILKQFAILDGDRRMRDDVASVQVFCPHPFLQNNVELLDLPGTNDREEQDSLVRDKLLTADLIVQVLDGRQLMTLGEREKLRDWLLDRGIKTIVFVVNFLNLLEPEDQKEVYKRLRFLAESFRADLPTNISNLYRVDALPALRARLKGDVAAAQSSGLAGFESALQSILAVKQEQMGDVRLPRAIAIGSQIKQILQAKIQPLATEVETAENKRNTKIQIQQKAENLIKQGFATSIKEFRDWLHEQTILYRYQSEATAALQQNQFSTWERDFFKPTVAKHQQEIVKWISQACEFFNYTQPEELSISFPSHPQVTLPNKPTSSDNLSDTAPVAVATGLGWVAGGPIGAAVLGGAAYLLNKNIKQDKQGSSSNAYQNQAAQLYTDAAKDYLSRFSSEALSALHQYEEKAAKVLNFKIPDIPPELTNKRHQLNLLNTCLQNLDRELQSIN